MITHAIVITVATLLSITLFTLIAGAFVGFNLFLGKLVRPKLPNREKSAAYECGEEAFGPGWVQFDLRFYIVALVYLVFAVEVALFYPWAVAYGSAEALADDAVGQALDAFTVRRVMLIDMLVFFSILMLGFAYLWRFGYLDWVHGAARRHPAAPPALERPAATAPAARPAVPRPASPMPSPAENPVLSPP